ncbi:MAG: cation diffusion facilitator family transporter, partial [Minisyncoccia bacterium]
MKETISKIAIGVNIILAGLKIFIGITNYSSAILAEGLHSFIDVFASFISYLGIKIAKKPADEKHPYGHFKFEVLAGLVVTLILVMTGLGIIYEAYQKFLHPTFLKISLISFGVMIFSAIVNEIMARLKINFGKKENSMVLISDGIHSRVDALTSLIVFVGLFLTKYWIYTDAFLAALIGLYIIRESVFLGKEAVD